VTEGADDDQTSRTQGKKMIELAHDCRLVEEENAIGAESVPSCEVI
jgi:hypothetical protein